nr:13283_t:CDS:2 [Entrophospora candida]
MIYATRLAAATSISPTISSNNYNQAATFSTNVNNSTIPTKPVNTTYSYSGPPKSYYSRLPLYDRPFKCDECPQSFNRNHDLKRHKRIHLAVKPFPCEFCNKEFSRKDALKRHMVVKGCDKKSQATSSTGVVTNNNSNKTATSSNASKPNKKLKTSSTSSISLSTNINNNKNNKLNDN